MASKNIQVSTKKRGISATTIPFKPKIPNSSNQREKNQKQNSPLTQLITQVQKDKNEKEISYTNINNSNLNNNNNNKNLKNNINENNNNSNKENLNIITSKNNLSSNNPNKINNQNSNNQNSNNQNSNNQNSNNQNLNNQNSNNLNLCHEKKSHSYSPNRLINSQMKLNNGLLPPRILERKTLVLDLDETLVHSGFMPFDCPSDVIIQIELDNEIHDIHVLVRPGVKEFL